MTTTLQPKVGVSAKGRQVFQKTVPAERQHPVDSRNGFFNFAVGFSRQPLPKGNRFAIVTNAGGPGIMATDASIRPGLELAKLRPETLDAHKAKLPPTANLSIPADVDHLRDGRGSWWNLSTAEEAGVGYKKITNGVKQKLPGVRLLSVEIQAIAGISPGPHPAA